MTPLSLALHLMGGVATGALYFGSLWWGSRLFEHAGRLRTLLAGMALRFILLGGILTSASLEGALPLLVTALGVLLARSIVLRRAKVVGMVTP